MHRPKYDDWSWAKGKLDPGEEWPVAADPRDRRGDRPRRAPRDAAAAGAATPCSTATGVPATKQVRYWAAEVVGGEGRLVNEIDEVAWLDVLTAHDQLDYARDRDQLRAVVRADAAGRLTHLAARRRPPRQGAPARLLDARRTPSGPSTSAARPRPRPIVPLLRRATA